MKFTTTVFAITVLTYNVANAGITCSSSECKADNMPLLDQMESSVEKKFGDMACVPTSSTMVMEAVFADKKDIVAGSFTESIYQQSQYGAVIAMGVDMKTTSQNGTYTNDSKKTFDKLATGFQSGASSFMYTNSTKSLTPANLFAEMQGGSLGSILFASYVPKCSGMASGRQTCSFTRQYGHSVAVQAASGSQVQIYDPSGADKWTSQLLKLADDSTYSGSTLSLPSHIGADARILDKNYYTSNEVDLAEYFYGLKVAASSSTPVVTQPSPSPSPAPSASPAPSVPPVVSQPSPAPSVPPVVTQPSPAPSVPPVVSQPSPAPSVPPVVTQPSPAPSPSVPVVTQPKPTTPVVTVPKSQTWQQWVKYFKSKGRFAARK